MALCLFSAAGTIAYWQAWVYLGLFSGLSLLLTLFLVKHDPALLERRLHAGPKAEKQPRQKLIQALSQAGFLALLVVPALDHRFDWSHLPLSAVITGDLLSVAGFALVFFVFRENTYASAIIETFNAQTVISTGPYRIVRHPMYLGAVLLFIGTPIALGSCWGLLAVCITLPALIWRLVEEEKALTADLPGYSDYCIQVRWRLLPGIF